MTNHYKNLKSHNLNDIYKLELAKFIYQLHHGTRPKSFYNQFIELSAIHNCSTRQKQHLVYFKPQIKKAIEREVLPHRGSYLRKEINLPLKILDGFFLKHNTKKFLIKIYNSAQNQILKHHLQQRHNFIMFFIQILIKLLC